jgi:hypothetical protein
MKLETLLYVKRRRPRGIEPAPWAFARRFDAALDPKAYENRTIFSLPSTLKQPIFVNASKLGGVG